MKEIYEANRDRADFLFVYVREAHPSDSNWADPKVDLKEPKTSDERRAAAKTCLSELKLDMPTVIDDMDDTASMSYSAWPERIYVIDRDGKIAFRTALGPMGFAPKKAGEALAKMFRSTDDDE